MNLNTHILPNSAREFSTPAYWRKFFAAREAKHGGRDTPFEWYGEYGQLASVLERYLKPSDRILQLGCGNSRLADQLWDNGYRNVLSIDTDAKVIEGQRRRQLQGEGVGEEKGEKRPGLKYEVKSADETGCPSESINVVLDKGTTDALLPVSDTNTSDEQVEGADRGLVPRIFNEVHRVLNSQAGRFIIITLAQTHVVEKVLNHFWGNCSSTSQEQCRDASRCGEVMHGPQRNSYLVRVHRCDYKGKEGSDEKNGDGGSWMPVFAIVLTKLRAPMPKPTPLEFLRSTSPDAKAERASSVEELCRMIGAEQEMAWFQHYVARNRVDDAQITLCSAGGDSKPRFELNVVDECNNAAMQSATSSGKALEESRSVRSSGSYAVFIVPLGRESDWLFSTKRGRQRLRGDCGVSRLLVVRLYPDQHAAPSLSALQEELSPVAMALKPNSTTTKPGRNLPSRHSSNHDNEKIPFLSLGTDDLSAAGGGGGNRERIAEGESAITGKWVVEQVHEVEEEGGDGKGRILRQLIFLDNPFMVQSEVEVEQIGEPRKKGGRRKGKAIPAPISYKLVTDRLSFAFHRAMLAAMPLAERHLAFGTGRTKASAEEGMSNGAKKTLRLAVLGLGGGLLARYLHDHYPQAKITCVELDPQVVDVAKLYFGFPEANTASSGGGPVQRLNVIIGDAMDFLKSTASQQTSSAPAARFDVIFLDLSSTASAREGISAPPLPFTTREAFAMMRACLALPNGVLAFNLVARDAEIAARVKANVKGVYERVYRVGINTSGEEEESRREAGNDDLNEVLLCSCPGVGGAEETDKNISSKTNNKNNNKNISCDSSSTEWLNQLLGKGLRIKEEL